MRARLVAVAMIVSGAACAQTSVPKGDVIQCTFATSTMKAAGSTVGGESASAKNITATLLSDSMQHCAGKKCTTFMRSPGLSRERAIYLDGDGGAIAADIGRIGEEGAYIFTQDVGTKAIEASFVGACKKMPAGR